MDALSTISNAMRIGWTAPLKLAGSVLGTVAVAGLVTGWSPLETFESIASWLGLPSVVGVWLAGSHEWVAERAQIVAVVASAVFAVFLLIAGYYRADRAAPVALLAGAVAVEAGSWVPSWTMLAATVLGVLTFTLGRLAIDLVGDIAEAVGAWLGRALWSIVTALFWWLVAPVVWISGYERRGYI